MHTPAYTPARSDNIAYVMLSPNPLTGRPMAGRVRLIRGRRYNRLKKAVGGDRKSSVQIEHLKTYDLLAKEYGVSSKTIQRDAKFAEEVENTPELAKAHGETSPRISCG